MLVAVFDPTVIESPELSVNAPKVAKQPNGRELGTGSFDVRSQSVTAQTSSQRDFRPGMQNGPHWEGRMFPTYSVVAGAGFEPTTFGL